ncbi:MAG TPA: GxxExxY protein [Opitutales bacterium]|jgi:GxxExxY protein|nr:GxxExxY protein [Opitutales bacterium]
MNHEATDLKEEEGYDLAGQVIGLAMKVHRTLGPGFLESVYHQALRIELDRAVLDYETEKTLTVSYEKVAVGEFKADLVIGQQLIVEIKAVNNLVAAHEIQLVNYLSATGIDEGLLLNFGAASLEFRKKFRVYRRPQDGAVPF